MAKKGQGISINVIIIAAIALLVLVVLSVIFLGRFDVFSRATKDCQGQGGTCVVGACPINKARFTAWVCPQTDSGAQQICCAIPS